MPEKYPFEVRRFPLDTARLIESDDPLAIGDNYQKLVNLRPGERHPKAIAGMTKITATALTFSDDSNRPAKIRNAIHFVKEEPFESHIVVEAYNYLENSLKLYKLDGTVPNADDFGTVLYTIASGWASGGYAKGSLVFPTTNNGYYYECILTGTTGATEPTWPTTELETVLDGSCTWVCRKGSLHGMFSVTDTGELIYSSNNKLLIWPGDEHKVGAVINCTNAAWPMPDPETYDMFDVTTQMLNTLTDDENIFIVTGLNSTGGGNYDAYVFVGSPYQLRGIKPYIQNPVSEPATGSCTSAYWNGTTFNTVTNTDGTASNTHTLSNTGEIVFSTDTVGVAKQTLAFGMMLYWYRFKFSNVPNTGTRPIIYYISVLASMQPISDIWDGTPVPIVSAWENPDANKYYDVSENIAKTDDVITPYYDGASLAWHHIPTTVLKLDNFKITDNLYFGSHVRLCGFKIKLAKNQNSVSVRNSNTATISIKYFNGTSFTSVSFTWDGTSQDGVSLWQTGTVIFTPPAANNEFKTCINNDSEFYYYKITWSAALDNDVIIDEVLGIPAPVNLNGNERAFTAQGRLFLVKGNTLSCSPVNRPTVHNGSEHASFVIGDDNEITGGGQLFNIQGSDYHSPILVFKKTATYLLVGTGPSWTRHDLSMYDGLAAPDTLCIINIPVGIPGLASTIAIGQGTKCVFICDGHAPKPVSRDIEQYFDARNSACIPANMIDKSVGFIDYENLEYHWLFASGAGQTTLNKEMVLSLKNIDKGWFEIVRENSILQYGVSVSDQYKRKYTYGMCDDGHVKRLEYGNTFDGNHIECIMWPGDITMTGNKSVKTKIENLQLISMAKTVTAENISCDHYCDASLTAMAEEETDFSPKSSGNRVSNAVIRLRTPSAIFHSSKISFACGDESVAFEPIDWLYHYEIDEQQTRPALKIEGGPVKITLPSSETKLTTPTGDPLATPG